MSCSTPAGLLDGMTVPQLQAALTSAQTAYIELMSGRRGVSFTYTQGEGNRAVTYEATTPQNLAVLINQLKAALGLPVARRRPLRMLYR